MPQSINLKSGSLSWGDASYVILTGATAAGKSNLAIEMARQLPSEIISADSRQVYIGMNIGTDTPPQSILDEIPHHFINELNPDVTWSAGEFYQEARNRIRQILVKGKLPIVVGGSSLYLDALQFGFFENNSKDAIIREKYEALFRDGKAEEYWNRLNKLDPDYAQRFHYHDEKKLMRAFEIIETTGLTPSQVFDESQDTFEHTGYRVIVERSRPKLYEIINTRVLEMINKGLVDECKDLLEKGFSPTLYPMRTIGYKEVYQYLDNEISKDRMIELIQQHSRNFAKRQLTWFRNHPRDFTIEL
jgi:tRNA dimethylallyltransferase